MTTPIQQHQRPLGRPTPLAAALQHLPALLLLGLLLLLAGPSLPATAQSADDATASNTSDATGTPQSQPAGLSAARIRERDEILAAIREYQRHLTAVEQWNQDVTASLGGDRFLLSPPWADLPGTQPFLESGDGLDPLGAPQDQNFDRTRSEYRDLRTVRQRLVSLDAWKHYNDNAIDTLSRWQGSLNSARARLDAARQHMTTLASRGPSLQDRIIDYRSSAAEAEIVPPAIANQPIPLPSPSVADRAIIAALAGQFVEIGEIIQLLTSALTDQRDARTTEQLGLRRRRAVLETILREATDRFEESDAEEGDLLLNLDRLDLQFRQLERMRERVHVSRLIWQACARDQLVVQRLMRQIAVRASDTDATGDLPADAEGEVRMLDDTRAIRSWISTVSDPLQIPWLRTYLIGDAETSEPFSGELDRVQRLIDFEARTGAGLSRDLSVQHIQTVTFGRRLALLVRQQDGPDVIQRIERLRARFETNGRLIEEWRRETAESLRFTARLRGIGLNDQTLTADDGSSPTAPSVSEQQVRLETLVERLKESADRPDGAALHAIAVALLDDWMHFTAHSAAWNDLHDRLTGRLTRTELEETTLVVVRIAIVTAICFGLILLLRFAYRRFENRLEKAKTRGGRARYQRWETVAQLVKSVGSFVIVVVGLIVVLTIVGVGETVISYLVGSVGILALAISFGAQAILRDFLAGFFVLTENQYAVGDYISIGTNNGTVEQIGLRTTILRDLNGNRHVIANGTIEHTMNFTARFSQMILDFRLSFRDDPEKVLEVLTDLYEELPRDPELGDALLTLLEPPAVWGVQEITDNAIVYRTAITTRPGMQWGAARRIRLLAWKRFQEQGLTVPYQSHSVFMQAQAIEDLPADQQEAIRQQAPRPDEASS